MATDRRAEVRFDVVAKVRYRILDRTSQTVAGVGQTVSISRSGMRLRVQHALHVGDRVAVTVDLLKHAKTGRAELTLLGQVVRVQPGCVALQFDQPSPEPIPELKLPMC